MFSLVFGTAEPMETLTALRRGQTSKADIPCAICFTNISD